MVFTATPVDGSSTPIPMSSVIPDGTNTPTALEGGPSLSSGGNNLAPASMYVKDGNDVTQGTSTDANTVNSVMGRLTKIRDLLNATIPVSVTNANANGQALMSASSPVVLSSDHSAIPFEPLVAKYVRLGQAFSATPGTLASITNANLTLCALSLFNPAASGKNILIYSIMVFVMQDHVPGQILLRATTADPSGGAGFTNVITPVNQLLGGGVGVASACSTANSAAASITPTGSVIGSFSSRVDTPLDLLSSGMPILLPAGSAHGIEVTSTANIANDTYSCLAKYVEY